MSARDWERLAQLQPHYAVLTEERFRAEKLDEAALREFFESGVSDAGMLFTLIEQYLGGPFAARDVLDFGCGAGRLSLALAARAERVVGIDVAPTMLSIARRHAQERGVENVRFTETPGDETFDLICSLIVFQHIPVAAGEAILRDLLRRVRPGGVVALHFALWRPGGPLRKFARILRGASPLLHRTLARLRGERDPLPYMQMNEYSRERIVRAMQEAGFREPMVKETRQKEIVGGIFVGQRGWEGGWD